MKTSMLVGYTGFVGSNIAEKKEFTWLMNSKNIEQGFGKNPEILVYAGIRAEKFLANKEPEADRKIIIEAFEQIKKINPQKLVLISTIDVYKNPIEVDEDTPIDTNGLQPYGANRYALEQMVRENWEDCLIVRLPGLFGKNLKKNFIYDYVNIIPAMLNEKKYAELSAKSSLIGKSYQKMDNGFYKCVLVDDNNGVNPEREQLKHEFKEVGFSALNFTDSRGVFQFYNLANLWKDIQTALANNIRLLNVATEPVSVSEIYKKLSGGVFENEIAENPPLYNYRSKYAELFGGENGYFADKQNVLNDIVDFVRQSEINTKD